MVAAARAARCSVLHSFARTIWVGFLCFERNAQAVMVPEGCFYLKMKVTTNKKSKNGLLADSFNAQAFLDTAGIARKVTEYRRNESIYSQGQAAETVMYIQKGGVKLSVVNGSGKEAVVAMFGPGDFFGEGCMAGRGIRMGTATAITPST